MEHLEHFSPGTLTGLLNDPLFVSADIPYRIRPFAALVVEEKDRRVRRRMAEIGSDGALLPAADAPGHEPLRMTLMEKLLILLLAKSANHVPGGGIWLNTQRPEWNDANNALAGWGLSVVTASYLIRFVALVRDILAERGGSDRGGADRESAARNRAARDSSDPGLTSFRVHAEVGAWFARTLDVLRAAPTGSAPTTPAERYRFLSAVGTAASDYREGLYRQGLSGSTEIGRQDIDEYLALFQAQLSRTVETSRRPDGCFESYQLLEILGAGDTAPGGDREAHIRTLYPMLEGQVAGISSGLLSPEEVVAVLDGLRRGPLYRADQHSYMLYPRRELPGFLEKNTISDADVAALKIAERPRDEWAHLLDRDSAGGWHFGPGVRNARDLEREAAGFPEDERRELELLFEATFDHAAFTGRSGTFFAYEGLGSIYWHMVSKLLLAVQEQLVGAVLNGSSAETVAALKERYIDVRAGLGFNKRPDVYGAVPTDPYSHTPWGQGAKQPGMTGQVKEEIVALRRARDDPPGGADSFSPGADPRGPVAPRERQLRLHLLRRPGDRRPRRDRPGDRTVPREYSEELFRRSGRVKELRVTL